MYQTEPLLSSAFSTVSFASDLNQCFAPRHGKGLQANCRFLLLSVKGILLAIKIFMRTMHSHEMSLCNYCISVAVQRLRQWTHMCGAKFRQVIGSITRASV